jgi:hypothetical protein
VGAEKGIRDRRQKSGAVSGFRIASRCAPVHQAPQNGDALRDDLMGWTIVQVGNESDAAGIMFLSRIIQTALSRMKKLSFHFLSPI